jgi:Transposase DDE domain group 1
MSGSACPARETCDCDIYRFLFEEGTSEVQLTAWSRDLRVTAGGSGVVSHVGAALLRLLADRAGLTGALSAGLARAGWWPVHDRGRVLVDLAVIIADGGEAIADIDVLRHQQEVFGPVASDSTVWRALDEIGAVQSRRIATARAKVRARMWRLFGGPPAAGAAGRDIGAGITVLDIDSTIVIAHSDKEGAAATYKHSYGFHPILVTCDNTGELLAIKLRPGNAGANTAADHLDVLTNASQAATADKSSVLVDQELAAESDRVRRVCVGPRTRTKSQRCSPRSIWRAPFAFPGGRSGGDRGCGRPRVCGRVPPRRGR